MAVPTETLSIELHGATHSFPILSLVDRRPRTHARKQWVILRAVEKLTHNVGQTRSAGQIAQHLESCSMASSILVCDKAAVTSGVLLQEELDAGTPNAQ
jgi:hypothetical protein